jgi:uridine kinase
MVLDAPPGMRKFSARREGSTALTRDEMLDQLAHRLMTLQFQHPTRVAVDGVDAAGKTTLADELAAFLIERGRPVIRASIDGFHRLRAERHRQGATSPEGYYADSFDYGALRNVLLGPLGPHGGRRFRRAIFDYRTDTPSLTDEERAPEDAILLFDGVFLLRPEINELWDYRIFVEVPFAVTVERAILRDSGLFGSAETTRARYQERYIPGQQIYLKCVDPLRRAQAIVQNEDPEHPALTFTA